MLTRSTLLRSGGVAATMLPNIAGGKNLAKTPLPLAAPRFAVCLFPPSLFGLRLFSVACRHIVCFMSHTRQEHKRTHSLVYLLRLPYILLSGNCGFYFTKIIIAAPLGVASASLCGGWMAVGSCQATTMATATAKAIASAILKRPQKHTTEETKTTLKPTAER